MQFEIPQDTLCHIGLMRMSRIKYRVSDDSRHLYFRRKIQTLKLVTVRGKTLIYSSHRSNLCGRSHVSTGHSQQEWTTTQQRKNIHKENQKENDWNPTCSQTIIFNTIPNREPRFCKPNYRERKGKIEIIQSSP